MHSECFFDNCSSAFGNVSTDNCDCSIVQHRFCSMKCHAYFYGHHSSCWLKEESTDRLNYVDESSACNCGVSRVSNLFYNFYGRVKFSSTNMSKNVAYMDTALSVASPNFEKFNYTTIESNNASESRIISLDHAYKYLIEYCNILKNFQEKFDYGIINIRGELTLNRCSILGDPGKGKYLYLHDEFSQITIKNSFYDNFTSNNNSAIATENNNKTSNYIHINYYYGSLCDLYPLLFNNQDMNIKNKINFTFVEMTSLVNHLLY